MFLIIILLPLLYFVLNLCNEEVRGNMKRRKIYEAYVPAQKMSVRH